MVRWECGRTIQNVIGEKTVVCGHSNGALTAAYIAAYGGENIAGAPLAERANHTAD